MYIHSHPVCIYVYVIGQSPSSGGAPEGRILGWSPENSYYSINIIMFYKILSKKNLGWSPEEPWVESRK